MQVFHIINAQNESEGGFTIEQLKALPIKPSTLVWYEGLGGWTKASELEVLKPLFVKSSPPPVSLWIKLGFMYGRLNWIQKIALYVLLICAVLTSYALMFPYK